MTHSREQTILLVSDDAALCAAARRQFETSERGLRVAEVRRKNDGRLPHGGQQRLETIAALAVRLREIVRRLSQESEANQHPAQAAKLHA